MKIQTLCVAVALVAGPVVAIPASAGAGPSAQAAPVPWDSSASALTLPAHHTMVHAPVTTAATTPPSTSQNWSGDLFTGPVFTGIHASWLVPSITPQLGQASEAQWIGVDGLDNQNLIQTGTAAANDNGKIVYFAWYEILPAPIHTVGLVVPGDHMSASVVQQSPGNWSITITDDTAGHQSTGIVAYGGPGSSAEFIEERPYDATSQSLIPLADFSDLRFGALRTDTDQSAPVTHTAMSLISPQGTVLSRPSPYDTTTDSEVITYTGPPPPPPQGYWLLGQDGGVFSFGDAAFHGSTGSLRLNQPVVGLAARPDRGGYWFVAADGGIFNFDAPFYGSTGGMRLVQPVVGMAPTPDGGGYWLVASDGGIFSFGDATFFGSTGAMHLNQPIVGMAASPTGRGYWFVARDGGIFSFGDAAFFGSGVGPGAPVVGMAATPDGHGYVLARSDGQVQVFGSAGGLPTLPPASAPAPVAGIALTPTGAGYRLVTSTGLVGEVGDAAPFGGIVGALNARIVGIG